MNRVFHRSCFQPQVSCIAYAQPHARPARSQNVSAAMAVHFFKAILAEQFINSCS